MMLTTALTLDLASRKLKHVGKVYNRSRWLMVAGIGLIAMQFLLQYTLHFRAMGVTQGVAVNLTFFMLSSWLVSLATLNIQRRGHVKLRDCVFGLCCWAVAMAILAWGTLADDGPLLSDTPSMRTAEYGAAIVFALMQVYHTWLHWHEFGKIKHALNQYYDGEEKRVLLGWMENSVYMLCGIAVLIPFIIFLSGPVLFFYSLFLIGFIYYSVSRFINYGADNALKRVEVAENIQKQVHLVDNKANQTQQAIDRWIAGEYFCGQRLSIQEVADEIGIERERLTVWLNKNNTDYAAWLNKLRVEKAKQLLLKHPDWSNEGVAQACGFADRSYFQRKFKDLTRMTPSQYIDTMGTETMGTGS